MATELGQAYVQIMPSAKGIKGSIEKELSGESASAGKSAGGMIATAIKGAITVAAIGKFIGSSLTTGGELQQSLGGVETLFKENADKVKQYANEAYKTAGLSANAYMENVTSFSASLLQSLGGDTEKAAEKANTAMVDMSDNSNKMGTSMESIQNAYQGFAKSNYTMLDNLKLGYGGTKTEMERLLTDATKLTGVKYDISNLSDVYDAIHVVQTELGITGTTAKESAETLSGSFASMKSSFTNFMGNLALGEDVTPSLKALAETVSTFLFGNFLPMVFNILKALPGAIVTFIKAAIPHFLDAGKEMISSISKGMVLNIPEIITGIGEVLNNFVEFIMINLPKIIEMGKELIASLVMGILNNLPEIISSAIKIVGNLVGTILKHLPDVIAAGVSLLVELVGGILSRLPDLIAAAVTLVVEFLGMIISKLPDVLGAGIQILTSIVSGIGQVAPNLYNMGAELMRVLISKITEKFSEFMTRGGEIVKNIISGISSQVTNAKNAINDVIQAIRDKVEEWKERFKTAGSNIVNSIADGIRGAISKVKNAIGDVVQTVRNYLPFSPAKEGPLKDLNRLNFGGTISEAILNAKRPVTKAMDELTKSMMSDFGIGNNLDVSMSSTKSGFTNKINHTGTIRVEGVNDRNELMSVVDIVMDELRREVRA